MIALQKYISLIIFMNHCGGSVIFKKEEINITNNGRQFMAHDIRKAVLKRFKEKKYALQDAITVMKKKIVKSIKNLMNNFHNFISTFSHQNISGNSQRLDGVIHKENVLGRSSDSNVNDSAKIHIYITRHKDLILDSKANGYLDFDDNLRDLQLLSTEISLDLDMNKTLTNTTSEDYPLLPVCAVGAGDCAKCQDISPFCHFMYSEKRCVYFNHMHASKKYECGERWFSLDRNEAFFTILAILLIVSSAITAYLILLHSRMEYEEEAEPDDEYIELRRAVEIVRYNRQQEDAVDGTHLNSHDT